MALLRDSISTTYTRLDNFSKQLYELHIKLSKVLHPLIFHQIDYLSQRRAEENVTLTRNKQKKKFEKLKEKQQPVIKQLDPKTVVVNKSSYTLSLPEVTALAKGLNFAIAPNRLPIEKIICGVEAAVINLPTTLAEQLRQDTSVILRKSKPPPRNISHEELRALKELKRNENIVILPADKGNATVILDSADYKDKMTNILDDTAYIKTDQDPTVYLEKKTRKLIKTSTIPTELHKKIMPQEKSSRVPRLYGLPKIHKPGTPLRPIVSAVNSPTHMLAKYLAKQIQPITEQAASYVKNSTHFVDLIKNITLNPEDILVSFDVVSLFTKVPTSEALTILAEKHNIPTQTISLAKHCMCSTYFIYDGQFYKQTEGAPMGSPLSPAVANVYMEDFETRALDSAPLKPRCWLRYVDDTFVIWQHGKEKLLEFLSHLNNIHRSIQFTMEIEENDKLPFLDVLVYKKRDGSLGHTVYRKTTHTNRYLNAASHHHPQQIMSVANSLATRARRITDAEHINSEARVFQETLNMNGFSNRAIQQAWNRKPTPETEKPEEKEPLALAFLPYVKGTSDRISKILLKENIKTIFTTDKKIGELIRSSKDQIQLEGKGVYEISCGDCNQTYIGQTGRNFSTRLQEHRNDIKRNAATSSLAQHATSTGHVINLPGMRSITSIENIMPRLIREAIEIEKRPHNLNKRDDSRRLPQAWKPILDKVVVHPTEPTEEIRQQARLEPAKIDKRYKQVNKEITISDKINKPNDTLVAGITSAVNPISSRTRSRTNIKTGTKDLSLSFNKNYSN